MIISFNDNRGNPRRELPPLRTERSVASCRHVDGPVTAPLAAQCVQARPRKIHILGLARSVQAGEEHTQPFGMAGDYPGLAARLVELFEALVPEALNHAVTSWVTV